MFSESFFKDVRQANEPSKFDSEGNQLVDDELRQAHSMIFNFLDYLEGVVKHSKKLGIPLDKTVELLYNGHMKRLGWVFEGSHLSKLHELFGDK